MASLDSLPADQRAVLQLVLQRGRSYDEIAELLSIDRAGVRDRALAAFDALGPQTRVPAERRSLITDYLLGQLTEEVSEQTRERLAQSASERAWARVVASELAELATGPLPEIPVEAASASEREPQDATAPSGRGAEAARTIPRDYGLKRPQRPQRPSSRRGGALVLVAGAAIAVIVVVILLVSGGSSSKRAATPSSTGTSAKTTGTTTTPARVVAQINLISPSSGSKAAGIAQVLKQSNSTGIVIVAQNMPANSKHDAYAVWLFNPTGSSHLLGFVNPGVGSNGRLQTAGPLPANAGTYKQLLVTLETQANPHAPGKIVLEGQLTGVS